MLMERNGTRENVSIVAVRMGSVLVLHPCVWTHLRINTADYDQEQKLSVAHNLIAKKVHWFCFSLLFFIICTLKDEIRRTIIVKVLNSLDIVNCNVEHCIFKGTVHNGNCQRPVFFTWCIPS